MDMNTYSIKEKLGALLLDAPRLFWCLTGPGSHWTRFGNRRDELRVNPEGSGVACEWEFTRPLHLCRVFPATARRLLATVLREYPIRFSDAPAQPAGDSAAPDVSFLIGHRGTDRLPHLLLTLRSIAAQQQVRVECIVVEQDTVPRVRDSLPPWVRYVHTPPPDPDMPYARSWAFNVAAEQARAPILIFHDNDILLPATAASAMVGRIQAGAEVVDMKRFIFYMVPLESGLEQALQAGIAPEVEWVIENSTGGGSLAITREAFHSIGGFDEQFIGWGGEDNEFWDRCLTRKVWAYGFLPLIHLWHAPQEGKRAVQGMGELTAELTLQRRAMDPEERIAELRARPHGGDKPMGTRVPDGIGGGS